MRRIERDLQEAREFKALQREGQEVNGPRASPRGRGVDPQCVAGRHRRARGVLAQPLTAPRAPVEPKAEVVLEAEVELEVEG